MGLLALITSCFALIYYSLFSAMSVYSPEIFIPWIFIPLIFYSTEIKGFYFRMHIVRLIFIVIFFSSAIWKIRTGAIFNQEQMSAILVKQYASVLAGSSSLFRAIKYLISHTTFSFLLYWAGFLTELIFIAGLFTRRFDRLLMVFLFVFLLLDCILMGINYFPWIAFAGCLYFSKYKLQVSGLNQ